MRYIDRRLWIVTIAVLAFVVACSGGNGTNSSPLPASSGPQTSSYQIALHATGQAIALPATAGMSESVTLPANDAPTGAVLRIGISTTLPASVPQLPAENSVPYMTFTLTSSADVAFQAAPKFTVTLPSTPISQGAYYVWSFNPATGWSDLGQLTISSKTLTFGGGRALAMKAGVVYVVIPFTAKASAQCPTPTPQPSLPPTPPPTDCTTANTAAAATYDPTKEHIYFLNPQMKTIELFDASANGNAAPALTIGGPNCGILSPLGIAVSRSGKIAVTDDFNLSVNFLTISAAGVPTLIGAITGFDTLIAPGVEGAAFDPAENVYITGEGAGIGGGHIEKFASGATGDVSPLAFIQGPNAGIGGPLFLAVDASGNMYVTSSGDTILEFAAGSNGDVAPVARGGGNTVGPLAVDASGNLYFITLVNSEPGIVEMGPGLTSTIATISGPSTGIGRFATGLAVDGSGKVFVASEAGGNACNTCPLEIRVFAPGAHGDVAPIATISGNATGLFGTPRGYGVLAVH